MGDSVSSASILIGDFAVKTAYRKGSVSADDLHDCPVSCDRRLHGIVLKNLECRGVLCRTGYFASSRRVCHGRPVARFALSTSW